MPSKVAQSPLLSGVVLVITTALGYDAFSVWFPLAQLWCGSYQQFYVCEFR